jgi:hypothetical protein
MQPNSQETILDRFTSLSSKFITDLLLEPLVKYVNNRNDRSADLTVGELSQVFTLPVSQVTTTNEVRAPFQKPVRKNGAATKTTTTEKGGSTEPPLAGGTCIYMYKKGIKEKQLCGNPTKAGSNYCAKLHSKEANKEKQQLNVAKVEPGLSPSQGAIPENDGPEVINIMASQYDISRGLTKMKDTNFILKTVNDKIYVLGRHCKEQKKMVPLTEDERLQIKKQGKLHLPEEEPATDSTDTTTTVATSSVTTSKIPDIPKLPGGKKIGTQ